MIMNDYSPSETILSHFLRRFQLTVFTTFFPMTHSLTGQ